MSRSKSLGSKITKAGCAGVGLRRFSILKARSDYLFKLRISFAFHIVIVAGINELQSSFCATLSHGFSIY